MSLWLTAFGGYSFIEATLRRPRGTWNCQACHTRPLVENKIIRGDCICIWGWGRVWGVGGVGETKKKNTLLPSWNYEVGEFCWTTSCCSWNCSRYRGRSSGWSGEPTWGWLGCHPSAQLSRQDIMGHLVFLVVDVDIQSLHLSMFGWQAYYPLWALRTP